MSDPPIPPSSPVPDQGIGQHDRAHPEMVPPALSAPAPSPAGGWEPWRGAFPEGDWDPHKDGAEHRGRVVDGVYLAPGDGAVVPPPGEVSVEVSGKRRRQKVALIVALVIGLPLVVGLSFYRVDPFAFDFLTAGPVRVRLALPDSLTGYHRTVDSDMADEMLGTLHRAGARDAVAAVYDSDGQPAVRLLISGANDAKAGIHPADEFTVLFGDVDTVGEPDRVVIAPTKGEARCAVVAGVMAPKRTGCAWVGRGGFATLLFADLPLEDAERLVPRLLADIVHDV